MKKIYLLLLLCCISFAVGAQNYSMRVINNSSCNAIIKFQAFDDNYTPCGLMMKSEPITVGSGGSVAFFSNVTVINTSTCLPTPGSGVGWTAPGIGSYCSTISSGNSNWQTAHIEIGTGLLYIENTSLCGCSGCGAASTITGCGPTGTSATWSFSGAGNSIITIDDY